MPRQWGKYELQLLVAEAFQRGRDAVTNEVPDVDDVLAAVGIEHPENVPFEPGKPRSWHENPKETKA